jgi:hypothetical protein
MERDWIQLDRNEFLDGFCGDDIEPADCIAAVGLMHSEFQNNHRKHPWQCALS